MMKTMNQQKKVHILDLCLCVASEIFSFSHLYFAKCFIANIMMLNITCSFFIFLVHNFGII